MKTRDIVRLIIWGLLFICFFTFGILGFVNNRINKTGTNEPIPDIIYDEDYSETIE